HRDREQVPGSPHTHLRDRHRDEPGAPMILALALAIYMAPAESEAAIRAAPRAITGPPAESEAAIRAAREAYNVAIERKDADAIARILAPGYHVVTGRRDQWHGVAGERERWAARFVADPTVTYRRSPREIRVNEAWG